MEDSLLVYTLSKIPGKIPTHILLLKTSFQELFLDLFHWLKRNLRTTQESWISLKIPAKNLQWISKITIHFPCVVLRCFQRNNWINFWRIICRRIRKARRILAKIYKEIPNGNSEEIQEGPAVTLSPKNSGKFFGWSPV